MDIRLDGKVALVTGGSRGIGRGIAEVFAASGAKVMITSRSEESCAETAKAIGENCAFEAGHIGPRRRCRARHRSHDGALRSHRYSRQ